MHACMHACTCIHTYVRTSVQVRTYAYDHDQTFNSSEHVCLYLTRQVYTTVLARQPTRHRNPRVKLFRRPLDILLKHVYMCICIHNSSLSLSLYIYIYIYIERERERDLAQGFLHGAHVVVGDEVDGDALTTEATAATDAVQVVLLKGQRTGYYIYTTNSNTNSSVIIIL